MRGVVYVDILFFVNALIGYFLLRAAMQLSGSRRRGVCVAAAAFAAAAVVADVGGKAGQRGADRIYRLSGT